MPSHLHPRSAATSTLFAGTLLASFVVVAVPHIWPCPRPRRAYMDGDQEIIVDEQGRLMRRVRRVKPSDPASHMGAAELEDIQRASQLTSSASSEGQTRRKNTLQEEAEIMRALQAETEALAKENARRECPVPKPKGILGRFLGFSEEDKNETGRSG